MKVKPFLIVVDIDGAVNLNRSSLHPGHDPGWGDAVLTRVGRSRPIRVHIYRGLIEQLAALNRRDDTEVVWLSWWPRRSLERLNRVLGLNFRILPLRDGKLSTVRVELMRAPRRRVAWLDDDEATARSPLGEYADILALSPDPGTGITCDYLDSVVAFFADGDGEEIIARLVELESWRWDGYSTPHHEFAVRPDAQRPVRPSDLRRTFAETLVGMITSAGEQPFARYDYTGGVADEPLDKAMHMWVETGVRVEFRPMKDRPGDIQLWAPWPKRGEVD